MRAMLSCLAYSAASCSMVLVNKAVMVQFDFHHNSIVMVVQGIVALLLMLASRKLGLLQFRSLSLPMIRMWLPVNIFFVLMIYTSFERCVVSCQALGEAPSACCQPLFA